MDKRFWAVIAAIAVIFVGIIWVNGHNAKAPSNSDSTAATNHIKGGNAKNVTLVEYGDFQCPVCKLYEPAVEQVFNKYQNDIRFQFRNFPLQQVHPNAFAGARAAEAASLQNKFWEMHDQLYQYQSDWSGSSDPLTLFQNYAKNLGLNADKFKTDMVSDQVNKAINADIGEGNKLKVNGTPTFFLNGKEIKLADLVGENNSPSADKFSQIIDKAIQEQAAKSSASTAPASGSQQSQGQ